MDTLTKKLICIVVLCCNFSFADEVVITQNPYNRISYTQDIENVYFTIEILDSNSLGRTYPNTDFASISVDKNKNKSIDEYLDTAYGMIKKNICGQYLIHERASTTCEKLVTRASVNAYSGNSQYSNKQHSIIEYIIPKSELSFDNKSAEVVFAVYSARTKYKYFPERKNKLFDSTITIPFYDLPQRQKVSEQPSNVRNMLVSKPRSKEQEDDCKLWINSNSISPTPEKLKYIQKNCQ